MKWFRLYSEARTDAKLNSLTPAQHQVWFNLMCFANEQAERGIIPPVSEKVLAVEVARGNVGLLQRTVATLQDLDIIACGEAGISFIHWRERQYQSDDVSQRVAKHRDLKRHSNVSYSRSNVVGTPPDTDTDTDSSIYTDLDQVLLTLTHGASENLAASAATRAPTCRKKKKAKVPVVYTLEFESWWKDYPRKDDKGAAFTCWQSLIEEGHDPGKIIPTAARYAEEVRHVEDRRFIKMPATFLGPKRSFESYLDGAPARLAPVGEGHGAVERDLEEYGRASRRFEA